jgi:hypothetical protein
MHATKGRFSKEGARRSQTLKIELLAFESGITHFSLKVIDWHKNQ